MKKIGTIVVDDHPLMAQATMRLLEQIEGVYPIGIAHNGKACFELAEKENPDLVFLDYQLPDWSGTQIAEEIKRLYPRAHVVIFTGMDVSDFIPRLLELRVSGIISKGTSEAALKHMVPCILDNHLVFPHSLFHHIKLYKAYSIEHVSLTEEEIQMMTLMVRGATYEQIAETIHVSKRSVDNYLRKIYEKLGVQNRVQAIERFVQSKLYNEAGGETD